MIQFVLFITVLLAKPHQQHGHKVITQGKIFEKPIKTIEYKGSYYRSFPTYCPAIHKRPKSWGKLK